MTAEHDPSPVAAPEPANAGAITREDADSVRRVLRALTAATGGPSGQGDVEDPTGEDPTVRTLVESSANDNIYSHDEKHDGVELSVILVAHDADPRLLSDALVALDAQGDEDFELLVTAPSLPSGLSTTEELLGQFRRGRAGLTRVVTVPDPSPVRDASIDSRAPMEQRRADQGRGDPLRSQTPRRERSSAVAESVARRLVLHEAVSQATGRYVSVLDASSVAFAHYAETLIGLARTSPATVLRARALAQPMRHLEWRGTVRDTVDGYEPVGGAIRASAERLNVLEHLLEHSTPPGSYAIAREHFAAVGPELGEDEALAEAALLGGVAEAPEVIVLLRRFEL